MLRKARGFFIFLSDYLFLKITYFIQLSEKAVPIFFASLCPFLEYI